MSLVPTLSVPATSTGARILRAALSPTSAPNPPTPPITCAPAVVLAIEPKSGIRLCFSAISTPAALYVILGAIRPISSAAPPSTRERRARRLDKQSTLRGIPRSRARPRVREALRDRAESADRVDERSQLGQSGTYRRSKCRRV